MKIEQIVSYIIIITIFLFTINILRDIYVVLEKFLRDKYSKYQYKIRAQNYIRQKEKEEKDKKIYKYFGLFELIFENCAEEEAAKKECYQIIQEKLKTQYKHNNLQTYLLGKLFFECSDFSAVDRLINDLIEFFEYFKAANNKKSIKTNVKISFFAKDGNPSFVDIQKILLQMSAISSKDQVIANDGFYNQYKQEKLNFFEFNPKGLVNLSGSDENIEIYRLLKRNI